MIYLIIWWYIQCMSGWADSEAVSQFVCTKDYSMK